MKTIEDTGFESGPWNLDECVQGKAKRIIELQCEEVSFSSNHFHRVFEMWAEYPNRPKVIALHTLG